jgi:hypothetical protein
VLRLVLQVLEKSDTVKIEAVNSSISDDSRQQLQVKNQRADAVKYIYSLRLYTPRKFQLFFRNFDLLAIGSVIRPRSPSLKRLLAQLAAKILFSN